MYVHRCQLCLIRDTAVGCNGVFSYVRRSENILGTLVLDDIFHGKLCKGFFLSTASKEIRHILGDVGMRREVSVGWVSRATLSSEKPQAFERFLP